MKTLTGKILFIFSLLVSFVLFLQFFGNLSDGMFGFFFGSDCLFLPSLYRDLFIDHNGLKGWNVSTSPNFIPEWPIYFFFNLIFGDFRLASFAYAFFNFFTISLLTVLIYKKAFGEISWLFLSYSNFAFACFLMLFLHGFDFITANLIFLSAFHNGAFLMALLSIYILLIFLEKGKNLSLPILLLVISLLGTLSDRLFLVFFTIPAISTIVVFIRNQTNKKKLYVILRFSVSGALLGLLLFYLLTKGSFINIHTASNRMFNFGDIRSSLFVFLDHMQSFYIRAGFHRLILMVSALSLLIGIIMSIRIVLKKAALDELNLQHFAIVLFTSVILVICLNPIINGTYFTFVIIRYNIQSFYIATTLLSVFLYILSKTSVIFRYLLITGIIFINIFFVIFIVDFEKRSSSLDHISNVRNYYPENVARLDSLSSKLSLKCGVAHYSYAKVMTMFSKNQVKVRHVYPNLAIYNHGTNNKWYIDNPNSDGMPKPVFNFIILNNFKDNGSIKELFQNRIDTIVSGDLILLKVPDFYFSPSSRRPVVINYNN